jgi:hypothetical protein
MVGDVTGNAYAVKLYVSKSHGGYFGSLTEAEHDVEENNQGDCNALDCEPSLSQREWPARHMLPSSQEIWGDRTGVRCGSEDDE